MIFEDCKRAGLQQPIVTDERGMVKVTFMRPDEAAPIFEQPLFFFMPRWHSGEIRGEMEGNP